MSNSGDVIMDSASPAQPAPALPVVALMSWKGLVAEFQVTPDLNDVNGNPTTVINIRAAFREKGDTADFVFTDYPGTYPAGVAYPVSFTVPKWGTDYEFAFETGN